MAAVRELVFRLLPVRQVPAGEIASGINGRREAVRG